MGKNGLKETTKIIFFFDNLSIGKFKEHNGLFFHFFCILLMELLSGEGGVAAPQ